MEEIIIQECCWKGCDRIALRFPSTFIGEKGMISFFFCEKHFSIALDKKIERFKLNREKNLKNNVTKRKR